MFLVYGQKIQPMQYCGKSNLFYKI